METRRVFFEVKNGFLNTNQMSYVLRRVEIADGA
jgi:hypothetical protein